MFLGLLIPSNSRRYNYEEGKTIALAWTCIGGGLSNKADELCKLPWFYIDRIVFA